MIEFKSKGKTGKMYSILNLEWTACEATWTRGGQNYRGPKCVKLRDLTRYPSLPKGMQAIKYKLCASHNCEF